MPTTMSSSRRVKPRALSGPGFSEAELRSAETGESEGGLANPRGRARDATHIRGAFEPNRPVPGGANIWGGAEYQRQLTRWQALILKKNGVGCHTGFGLQREGAPAPIGACHVLLVCNLDLFLKSAPGRDASFGEKSKDDECEN